MLQTLCQRVAVFLSALFLLTSTAPTSASERVRINWIRQFGSDNIDYNGMVASDGAGNAYLVGGTRGSLAADNPGQSSDVVIRKYGATGAAEWTRQLGDSSGDLAYGVAASPLGGIVVVGATEGSLNGSNFGDHDAFVARYAADGQLEWTRQWGSEMDDRAIGAAVDSAGNVIVAGGTIVSIAPTRSNSDSFIRMYDGTGNQVWQHQFGTAQWDHVNDVTIDSSNNIYVAGETQGSLGFPNAGSSDIFLARYSPDGTQQWVRQYGSTSFESARAITSDTKGNVYICGLADGSWAGAPNGDYDAFVAKLTSDGELAWTRQIGTAGSDACNDVAIDGLGNLFIAGVTYESLAGPSQGYFDVFVQAFDLNGSKKWSTQFGTKNFDFTNGLAADGMGGVFVAGDTDWELADGGAVFTDLFLAHIDSVPVPG